MGFPTGSPCAAGVLFSLEGMRPPGEADHRCAQTGRRCLTLLQCHNKLPQTQGLQTTEIYSLIALEAGSQKPVLLG